ncbi:carbohydrate-binding protein [Pyxidicoccus trucidator]|uniref:carbohydrate-binding protein n=1 Tax=Pyxidicoccus trucidator TaxID=2709662 RepID=UPI0013D97794|nr:carbohydrate-binding protein [Pyxidicoccus trucidator]
MKKLLGSLSAALFLLLPAVAAAETTWVMSASVPVVGAGGGYVFYQFQLTTGVWPVAPGHTAGVVYTWDNWQTTQSATLAWQSNQPNAYGSQDEVWNGRFNIPPYISFSAVQYAIYVDDASGNRTWNNNSGQNFVVAK